jgi:predicted SAM-dependent methyltransferase
MKLINLGCGSQYHKDWTNVDFVSSSEYVIPHDLLRGIPFPNSSFDVVYHSHLLEHFSKDDGVRFVEECYRVLNTNGIIRIAVPDLETIAKEYIQNLQLAINGHKKAKEDYEWIKLELFDQMVRNESGGEMKSYLYQPVLSNEDYVFKRIGSEGKSIRETFLKNQNQNHNEIKKTQPQISKIVSVLKKIKRHISKVLKKRKKNILTAEQNKALKIGQFRLGGEIHQWMYDRYSLSELLKRVGFTEVKICNAFESEIKNWETYQLDVINGEVRKPDSLFIEARKL